MLVPMVDVIFADVAQPDQARIVGLNAAHFLKNGGAFVISIKASCIDSTAPPEAVFAREVKKLQEQQLKPKEQVRCLWRWLRVEGAEHAVYGLFSILCTCFWRAQSNRARLRPLRCAPTPCRVKTIYHFWRRPRGLRAARRE